MKEGSKIALLKNSIAFSAYLLVVWGFYRFLFKLPEEIEEIVIKPLLWLTPVGIFLWKEKANLGSVGVTGKNIFKSLYLSMGLGFLFLIESLFINYLKYSSFSFAANIGEKLIWNALFISFATAISEEIAFRGYLFNRVQRSLGSEWIANVSTSIVWALIHVPVVFFVWKLGAGSALIYLILTTVFGMGSAFVFARTGNIISSILLHVVWEWPIVLFR